MCLKYSGGGKVGGGRSWGGDAEVVAGIARGEVNAGGGMEGRRWRRERKFWKAVLEKIWASRNGDILGMLNCIYIFYLSIYLLGWM